MLRFIPVGVRVLGVRSYIYVCVPYSIVHDFHVMNKSSISQLYPGSQGKLARSAGTCAKTLRGRITSVMLTRSPFAWVP